MQFLCKLVVVELIVAFNIIVQFYNFFQKFPARNLKSTAIYLSEQVV